MRTARFTSAYSLHSPRLTIFSQSVLSWRWPFLAILRVSFQPRTSLWQRWWSIKLILCTTRLIQPLKIPSSPQPLVQLLPPQSWRHHWPMIFQPMLTIKLTRSSSNQSIRFSREATSKLRSQNLSRWAQSQVLWPSLKWLTSLRKRTMAKLVRLILGTCSLWVRLQRRCLLEWHSALELAVCSTQGISSRTPICQQNRDKTSSSQLTTPKAMIQNSILLIRAPEDLLTSTKFHQWAHSVLKLSTPQTELVPNTLSVSSPELSWVALMFFTWTSQRRLLSFPPVVQHWLVPLLTEPPRSIARSHQTHC